MPGVTEAPPPPPALAEVRGVGGELALAARLAVHVVFWCGLVVAVQRAGASDATAASPFVEAFAALPASTQRLVREVREGIAEIEARRARTGAWPDVASLAEEGVPPFARDPFDRAGYRWSARLHPPGQPGPVNYVGVPDAARAPGAPVLVVLILEPGPDEPVDPRAVEDEIHHRLRGGPLLHVTVWAGPKAPPGDAPVAFLRLDEGYKQIVWAAGAGAAALEER